MQAFAASAAVLVISALVQYAGQRLHAFTSSRTTYISRLLRPVSQIARGFAAKALIAFLSIESGLLDWFSSVVGGMIDFRAEMAFALAVVMLVDFMSGLYAAWWRRTEELGRPAKPIEFIESKKIRKSLIKTAEYITILLLVTVGGNVWETELGWAKRWVGLILFLTELWSVRENLQHASARGVLARLRERMSNRPPQGPPE